MAFEATVDEHNSHREHTNHSQRAIDAADGPVDAGRYVSADCRRGGECDHRHGRGRDVIALRAITPLSIGPIVDHRERPRPTAPRSRSQRATTPPKKLATHSPLAPFIFVPAMLVANRYAIAGPQNVVRRIETFISNPTATIIVSTLEPP